MTLRCHFESTGPVLVVRLVGLMRMATATCTWRSVGRLLSDQPDALVVDLTEAGFDEARALLVLGALAHRASLWPGVPVILAVPDPPMRAALRRQGLERQVAVCPDRDEALLLAAGAPTPPRIQEHLEPVVGAARRARDLSTEACLRWQLSEAIAPACIIANELVSNAVRWAPGGCELTLARTPRYLHIAVHDESPNPAVRQNPDPVAPAGRGLLIVERTALTWGSSLAQRGKVVWATLPAR